MSIGTRIDIAVKIREAHAAARSLFGEGFAERVRPWREQLVRVMHAKKLNEVAAGLHMLKRLPEAGDKGIAMMMIMAAVVEEIGKPTSAAKAAT